MSKKTKNGGGRTNLAKVSEALTALFNSNPDKTFSFKQIFKALHLDNHPKKMLAIQVLDDMEWDDFISRVAENSYKLNLKSQKQVGTFIRKGNGRNSFQP
ncbi:MAG: ribonuclease R, partial [Prevotella sp.]|nr:ribonuclease R [Prevotella sp.]